MGKNNLQNDALTFGADKTDIWFHVKGFPGSHAVLFTGGAEPTDLDYTESAMLAAYHSKASGGVNVQVDYTPGPLREKARRRQAGLRHLR